VKARPIIGIPLPDSTICLGSSVTYTVNGAGSYDYLWTGPNVNSPGSTVTIQPASAGIFTYTVTASIDGCSTTLTRTVTVKPLPPVIINATLTNLCIGSSSTLTASGATSYVWTGNGLSATTGTSVIATPTAAGTYIYQVTGTSSGCSETAAISVTVSPLPTVQITQNDTAICTGASIQLNATGAVTYAWTPATYLNATNTATVTSMPAAAIIYTVTGSNAGGCVASDQISINLLPVVTPSVVISYTGCPASTLNFTATPTNGGGTPAYQWLVNNTVSGTGSTFTLNNAVNGMQVSVIMTSANACVTSPTATQSVTVNCITTAVVDIDGLESYYIAPNPTSGLIRVEMKLTQLRKVSFSLVDAFGRMVYQSSPANLSGSVVRPISLEGRAAGLYFLKVMVGKEYFVGRIVKVE
jgi:hypothetical protein